MQVRARDDRSRAFFMPRCRAHDASRQPTHALNNVRCPPPPGLSTSIPPSPCRRRTFATCAFPCSSCCTRMRPNPPAIPRSRQSPASHPTFHLAAHACQHVTMALIRLQSMTAFHHCPFPYSLLLPAPCAPAHVLCPPTSSRTHPPTAASTPPPCWHRPSSTQQFSCSSQS